MNNMFYDIQYKCSGNLIQICPVDFVLSSGPHNDNNTIQYYKYIYIGTWVLEYTLTFYRYVPKLLGKLRQA